MKLFEKLVFVFVQKKFKWNRYIKFSERPTTITVSLEKLLKIKLQKIGSEEKTFKNDSLWQISSQMSQHIQQLICLFSSNLFLARVTIQNIEFIELAYKSISFDDLQKLFGLKF
jgi:hypothetical protein